MRIGSAASVRSAVTGDSPRSLPVILRSVVRRSPFPFCLVVEREVTLAQEQNSHQYRFVDSHRSSKLVREVSERAFFHLRGVSARGSLVPVRALIRRVATFLT